MPDPARIAAVDTLVLNKGAEAEFAAWLSDFETALSGQPGHCGPLVRLDQAPGIVHLLHQFSDHAALDGWLASDRRATLATAAEQFAIGRTQTCDGTRPRLVLPSEASAAKWKRVLVSWATVFPLLLATSYASQALVPGWPRPLTLALSSLAITLMLNLLIFPRVNRRMEPWLLEASDGGVRTPGNQ